MKRSTKKGFTIVELVIVIAVIAILAAVLIPTFSSLIRKANIASDTQLAKNLNTALTMGEAENGTPDDFAEVLQILRDNGFIISNLNPTTKGWYYVWESASNQIILVDGESNYAIKYQSKEIKAENTTPGATWHFAVSEASKVASIKALGAYVIYAPKTTEDLMSAFGGAYAEGGTIALNSDIILGEDKALMDATAADKTVTVDLMDNTLTNTGFFAEEIAEAGRSYNFGQLTAKAGTLNIKNGELTSEGNGKFVVAAAENGKVYVENVSVNSAVAGSIVFRVIGSGAHMNVKDTVVNLSDDAGGCEIGIGTATFENVEITLDSEAGTQFYRVCLAASRGGTLTVNSGTYTAKGASDAVIGLFTTAGNYVINGGTFVAEDGVKMFKPYDASGTYGNTHTIEIKGGTFTFEDANGEEKTVVISDLTPDNFESEIKSMFDAGNYPALMDNITVVQIEGGYKVTID